MRSRPRSSLTAVGCAVVSWVEVLGFVSGAACVWLATRQNVWNFPVGIANNLLFLWLFAHTGLYANAGLQVVFAALAVLGWVWWVRGGTDHAALVVTRTPRWVWPAAAAVVVVRHRRTDGPAVRHAGVCGTVLGRSDHVVQPRRAGHAGPQVAGELGRVDRHGRRPRRPVRQPGPRADRRPVRRLHRAVRAGVA